MKKFLEDVDAPTSNLVSNKDLFEILKEKGCCKTELSILQDYIQKRDVIDVSGFSGNTTFIVPEHNKNKSGLVVKISQNENELFNDAVVTRLMAKKGCSSNVLNYFSSNKDYLITEVITSSPAIDEFTSLDSMAAGMGKSLRQFHEIDWKKDEFTSDEIDVLVNNPNKFIDIALSHEEGLSYLKDYIKEYNYRTMKKYILEYCYKFESDEVIVHGDFNPRNIFINKGKLDKMIDFTDTHYGDRHYDIYFTMWSSALYLGILDDPKKIEQFNRIFLDSYGRDVIDYERLRLCGNIVCMYWQEHNDINGLSRSRV